MPHNLLSQTRRALAPLVLFLLLLTACGEAEGPTTVRLLTHDSFAISEATLEAFSAETGHTVELIKAGDAGQMVNQSILAAGNPLADVIFGIDNTFLSRALDNDILIPYASPNLAMIPQSLQLDPENRALPVDYGDVCLNYDKAALRALNLDPPAMLEDLVDPAYRGLTAVENPATSSPGLAFLMATVARFGEARYIDYWEALRANEVLVTSGWEEAYYEAFSLYGGDRPIVVSYASSPAAEVIFAETALDEAPTASVLGAQSCFRQIEFIGILAGTPVETAAQDLIDFMLDETFQADIPLNMFVYPANANVALPDEFAAYAEVPAEPAVLDPATIAANRDAWIEAWTEAVLR